jgi:hypothetical protein
MWGAAMDLSIVKDLNRLFARADGLEDPLVWYANASELLFLAALVLAFLFVGGRRGIATRRAVVAAGFSAVLGLAVAAILARAALGGLAALTLHAPRARRLIDALADRVGALLPGRRGADGAFGPARAGS